MKQPLLAAFAALIFAPFALGQTLDGNVAPAIANARTAVARQKKLAQADAAAENPAAAADGDEKLRQTLRDIALRACAGTPVLTSELYAVPAPSNSNFLDGRLPEGLSFANCAGKLYMRLGLKLLGGEGLVAGDIVVQSADPLQPAPANHNEIPAVAAPPTAPVAPAPPLPGPGPTPVPASGPSAEEVARRSLQQQNRDLGRYDNIVRRADGERRRGRDHDRRP